MLRLCRHIAGLAGFATALMASVVGPATALEDGDVIRIIVPYSAGGGFDAQARLAAPYIEACFQEAGYSSSNVIVENLTGGGGAVATATIFNGKPDGTVILILDTETSVWQQVVAGAAFDLGEFSVIAQQSAEPLGWVIRSDLGLESWDAVVARSAETPILLGTSGVGSLDHVLPLILQRILQDAGHDLKIDFLHLAGTSDILASIRRGEAEATYNVISTFVGATDEGETKMLWTAADSEPFAERWPQAGQVLDIPQEDLDLFTSASFVRRIYVAPPGVDEETLTELRDVFACALTEEELLAKSQEANRPIVVLSGEEAAEVIQQELTLAERFAPGLLEQLQ